MTRSALNQLPPEYILHASLSLKNRGSLIGLNIVGIGLAIFFGWLFTVLAVRLRPELGAQAFSLNWSGVQLLFTILIAVAIMFVVLVLHEAVHGLGFLLLAGVKPVFAFKGFYAYAAAPGVYISRNRYIWIGIAPLVVLSLAALGLLMIVPPEAILAVILAAVMNGSGAVGDLWVVLVLLRQPAKALALDQGDHIQIYVPAP